MGQTLIQLDKSIVWGDAYMGIIITPSGRNFTTTRDLHDMNFTVEKVYK